MSGIMLQLLQLGPDSWLMWDDLRCDQPHRWGPDGLAGGLGYLGLWDGWNCAS